MKNIMGDVSKLTQVQKSYLIRRIRDVESNKLYAVTQDAKESSKETGRGSYGYRPNEHTVDEVVAKAIMDDKVKLVSRTALTAIIKARRERSKNNNNSFYLNTVDFINNKSLESFNIARMKKIDSIDEKSRVRKAKISKEASVLADKVMLEGSLAMKLLEDFEKKVF